MLSCATLAMAVTSCAESLAPGLEIVLSQPSVELRAVRGTTSPVSRTITVSNSGDGRLGPVSCSASQVSWLTCSVANGNSVTFTADPSGLNATPAAIPVQITAPGAPGRPQTVTVNLIIDQPVLTLSTSTVTFAASESGGGTTPATSLVTVTNTGAGTLSNLGAITCAAVPANARVSCAVNQSAGTLTLSVDPAGLAPGTYLFPVRVSAANDNVAKTIALTVAVSAVPRIALSQGSVVFQVVRGATTALDQTITVTNGGGGTLGAITCPSAPAAWLGCTVSGGTLTLTANPSGLTASPATVSVPVTAVGATNNPQSVTVAFTIRQPVLAVDTNTLAFTTNAGGTTTNPTAAKVVVTNAGEGTLASLGQITCAPPVGSPVTCQVDAAAGELTITVNPTGIVGTKIFAVAVSAPNSSVSRVVTVLLTSRTAIALSPQDVNFEAIRGSTTNIVKKVAVTNSGGGTLGTVTCPANPAVWLTCTVSAGDTLVLTAAPTGLTVSPAEVLVPVSAAGALNNPQNVTVNFTILQPVIALSANTVTQSVAAGGTTTASTVNVTNAGAGTLASLGTITCTPSNAHVTCTVNQGTGVLSITVNTATAPALVADKYVFTLTVSAANVTNPQTIVVVLTVT